MTAVIGSFQGSHKAHDRYELESLKQQFDLEISSICTTNSYLTQAEADTWMG